jgi:hypothetical protein
MRKIMMLCGLVLAVATAAPGARADGEVTGRASLTMWFDYTSGVGSIDLWEKDGKILGRSAFSNWPISFAQTVEANGSSTWKGNADEGYVEFNCTAAACSGQLGSDTLELTLAEGGARIQGALNHVHVNAKNTVDEIEVGADGSLALRKKSDGKYNGSGFLDQNIDTRFTATLKLEGTLKERIKDPGFFTIFLVSPFVRN